jgi:serine protease Do
MTQRESSARRGLAPRRVALLASVGLGVAVLAGVPVYGPSAWAANDQPIQAPATETRAPVSGFADLVAKVKPAVISVQVRFDAAPRTASINPNQNNKVTPFSGDLRDFFRRFGFGEGQGGPNGQFRQPNAPNGQQFGFGEPQQPRRTAAEGSGFFISADGYAVTNNHVVENANKVQVVTDDGRTLDAKVIGTDPKTDLAVIKVDGNNFPFVKFSDRDPRVGDWVIAVGNPFGLGGTVTVGVVSARGRDIGAGPYDDFMQIDAPINRGNSGGPSFDVNGEVIGVNTAIYSPSGGSVGIGFDIPSPTAKMVVAQLREKGYVTRGWMGVQVQGVTKDIADGLGMNKTEGAIVDEPQPGSPAAKAGLKSGDVILAVDGKEMKDGRDLARTIANHPPGTEIKLDVWHDGQTKTMSLTLGQMPNERQANAAGGQHDNAGNNTPRLGLTLAPANEVAGAGDHGVAVTAVDPNGPAAEHGMQTGDVILDVAGKTVAKPDDVRQELMALEKAGKHTVLMRVKSGDATHFVAVPLGNA